METHSGLCLARHGLRFYLYAYGMELLERVFRLLPAFLGCRLSPAGVPLVSALADCYACRGRGLGRRR